MPDIPRLLRILRGLTEEFQRGKPLEIPVWVLLILRDLTEKLQSG